MDNNTGVCFVAAEDGEQKKLEGRDMTPAQARLV